MIEKFNNIFYLIIFLVHFAGIGMYKKNGTKESTKQQISTTVLNMTKKKLINAMHL